MIPRLTALSCALAIVACDAPPYDRFPSPKGNAPELLGVIEGSVIYVGPRPSCNNDASDIDGRVVLTLFHYDNPPPPAGSATSALSILTIPGNDFFDASDCLPANPSASDLASVSRSAAFVWPQIKMGAAYQIRGFWDNEGDFAPFFSVRKSPTAGDVVGGAFENPEAATLVPTRISFGSAESHPKGQIIKAVVVTLAAPIVTQPPLFRLGDDTQPLASHETFPALDPTTDPVGWEAALWDKTQIGLSVIEPGRPGYATTFAAAGLQDFFGAAPLHAWYVREVDVDQDGNADPHPILGGSNVPWQYPIVILRRAQTPAELEAGIPSVSFFAALRQTQVAVKRVFYPEIDLLLPPIAVVDLDPSNPACRVPYIPPGNVVSVYEGSPVECQELPTGRYSISVLHGLAGAVDQDPPPDATVSDTGTNKIGGVASGQSWSIPNELGPADQRFQPSGQAQLDTPLLLDEQGPAGRYVVHELNAEDGVRHDCLKALDPELYAAAAAGGYTGQELLARSVRDVVYQDVPAPCCAAVSHLCGLPLCDPFTTEGQGYAVREVSGAAADGSISCVPFEMPASCCPSGG